MARFSAFASMQKPGKYNDAMKVRIDKLLVERGLLPSRERAQAMVLSGRVLVNEQKVEKAGAAVDPDAEIRLLGDDLKYVGRGGLKLEAALENWEARSCRLVMHGRRRIHLRIY